LFLDAESAPYGAICGIGVEWERVRDEYIVSMNDAILLPLFADIVAAVAAPPTDDSDHAECE